MLPDHFPHYDKASTFAIYMIVVHAHYDKVPMQLDHCPHYDKVPLLHDHCPHFVKMYIIIVHTMIRRLYMLHDNSLS